MLASERVPNHFPCENGVITLPARFLLKQKRKEKERKERKIIIENKQTRSGQIGLDDHDNYKSVFIEV